MAWSWLGATPRSVVWWHAADSKRQRDGRRGEVLSLCLTIEVLGQSDSAEAPRGTRASGSETGCIQLTNDNRSSFWAAGARDAGCSLNTSCNQFIKSHPFSTAVHRFQGE
jgi:hypothetical protein